MIYFCNFFYSWLPYSFVIFQFYVHMYLKKMFAFDFRSIQNQEDVGYNESDYDDSPPPAQSIQEYTESKSEDISKMEEANIENEIMEDESVQEYELEEAEARNSETMFPKFIETTIPSVSNLCSFREEDDSTTLMFKLLDRKIKQASLTETQLSDMETSVMMFVYKKLAEYKN